MEWCAQHLDSPDAGFDGGSLDCGSGLLLLIRRHIDPLDSGQLLEIRSTDASVETDLPAWCRLTGNDLVSAMRQGSVRSYLVRKGNRAALPEVRSHLAVAPVSVTDTRIGPLAVMGIGSWPRPTWLLRALHDRLEGRMSEAEFEQTADDAVRLAIAAQERAGVDVVTDGEMRRDSYASFVGGRLEGCQLIPVTDLLPYVDHPDEFAAELRALDVPAERVRHPAVFGPIRRTRSLAGHELAFAQRLTRRPIKIALPGPYLLTRTMWLECVSEKAYATREVLAADVVAVLRAEAAELIASGAAIVQFDEPVLTEVVFGQVQARRSFMCGALGERREPERELEFAAELLQATLAGLPRERLALHVCRGNWSRDERVALAGDYRPLLSLFQRIPVGTFFLELCTPRAGELAVLRDLPAECRIGVGVVNQKLDAVESVAEIASRIRAATRLFGADRVRLNPDCGFATFADNPVTACETAEAKLAAIVTAAREVRSS